MRQGQVPPVCRAIIRRTRSIPIANELHGLVIGALTSQLPQHALGQALRYTLNQWDKLMVCLLSGDLELDNNLFYAERGIKQIMPRPELCRVAA